MTCLALGEELREQKAAAIRAHQSQVRPTSGVLAAEAPLSGRVLGHFHAPFEHYVTSDSEPEPPAPRLT